MKQVVARSLGSARFNSLLFSSFAILALALGIVGVYGLTSYVVSQRIQEIGVRLALGARGLDVIRSTFRSELLPVAGGLAAGAFGALVITRFISSLLYGVTPTDPVVLGSVVGFLFLAAAGAILGPARRAAGTDPLTSLRRD